MKYDGCYCGWPEKSWIYWIILPCFLIILRHSFYCDVIIVCSSESEGAARKRRSALQQLAQEAKDTVRAVKTLLESERKYTCTVHDVTVVDMRNWCDISLLVICLYLCCCTSCGSCAVIFSCYVLLILVLAYITDCANIFQLYDTCSLLYSFASVFSRFKPLCLTNLPTHAPVARPYDSPPLPTPLLLTRH